MSAAVPDEGVVRSAVALACRAPSLHNSQPWRWRATEHTLHLHADRTRTLAAADPHGRELTISCGAALHHVRVAFASMGWRTFVRRLPNPADPDHLASIEYTPLTAVPRRTLTLASAIPARHTDRRPYLAADLLESTLADLVAAAAGEHASLVLASSSAQRRELTVAMSLVNSVQRDDPEHRAELAAWAGRSRAAHEGVPAAQLRDVHDGGRAVLGRDFAAAGDGELTAPPIDDGATFAVLATDGDDVRSWLHAGEALSAVLLTATAAGLATCTLSQIGENPLARDVVRDATLDGGGQPQLLVRVGVAIAPAPPTSPVARRPVDDVLDRAMS